jgi:hypothetical protein
MRSIACSLATERGTEVCAPVHDAEAKIVRYSDRYIDARGAVMRDRVRGPSALHLLHLHWKGNGTPVKLANGTLAKKLEDEAFLRG